MAACRSSLTTYPELKDPDARVVIGFLEHYQRHDLDGMMNDMDEGAVFHGSDSTLNKQQIKSFLQQSLEKHPGLRIEFGPPRRIQDTLQVNVRLENNLIAQATWIFVVKNHKIHAYSIQPSGTR